jgi:hypothetical protein
MVLLAISVIARVKVRTVQKMTYRLAFNNKTIKFLKKVLVEERNQL